VVSKRRVACFDIDATLHRGTRSGESLGECVARECVRRGLAPANAFEQADGLRDAYDRRRASYGEYGSEFCRKLEEGFFAGLDAATVHALAEEIATRERERTYVFTRELLHAVQECGYFTIAISGSFHGVVEPFAKAWGFDLVLGTQYDLDHDGTFFGTMDRVVVHAEKKGEVLKEIIRREDLEIKGSIAVGDTLGDASMLEVVEYPILFNPDVALLDHFENKPPPQRRVWLIIERRIVYHRNLGQLRFLSPDVCEVHRQRMNRQHMPYRYL
jgi:HAD superfamily hydrolase (TIGR01490 family)